MKECDIAIIGAGVVGLAIAHKVCNKYSVIVIEAEDSFGKHTSSRNSETIHSGIYYPADTLKAKLCLRGNELHYQYARDNDISFLNCGKYIIASDDSEVSEIHRLFENGNRNGVPNLRLADGKEIEKTEPMVKCLLGVHVPTAGIINSHEFMKSLETKAKEKGALFAYRSKVERIIPENKNYSVITDNGELKCGIVINSAGLFSDKVAESAGIDPSKEGYKLHYCKGEYYKTNSVKKMSTLIYPVPSPDGKSLGIHNRLSTDGSVVFGPNAYYLEENKLDYSLNKKFLEEFKNSLSKFLKADLSDLTPYDCGIRPKLQARGEKFRDFVIKNEKEKGLANFINLIGIESPGLTSSLAIAEYIETIII